MPQPSITQRNAAWAEQFRNSTTNAAQRSRYRQDIASGEVEADMADAEAFEEAQFADPKGLGKLVLDRRKFNLDERKFGLEQEKIAAAKRKEEREILDANRIIRDTDALEDASFKLREAGMHPGSPGYTAGIGAAAIRYKYARPDLRATLFRDAKIDHDPQDFLFDAERLGIDPDNMKWTIREGADGRPVWSVTEAAPAQKTEKEGQIFESFEKFRETFPNGGIGFDLLSDGKVRATGGTASGGAVKAGADSEKEYESVLKEWKDAVSLRARMTETKNGKEVPAPGFSDNDRLLADKLKTRFERRLTELESGMKLPAQEQSTQRPGDGTGYDFRATSHKPADTPSAATSASTPVPQVIINRKTGERMILKDGAWQPLK